MGDKVSKIKKGVVKNIVVKVEFLNELSQGKEQHITGDELVDLFSTIAQSNNTSVVAIRVGGVCLTDSVAQRIGEILKGYTTKSSSRKPATLSLEFLESHFSCEGITDLVSALEVCDVVKSLSILGNNQQTVEESLVSELGHVLEYNKTLQHFELGGFAATPQTIKGLCTVIAQQKTVKSVSLVNWALKPEFVGILIEGVNNVLEKLSLRSCEVGNEGCRVIGDILARKVDSGRLASLDLTNNSITSKGVEFLLDALVDPFSAQRLSSIILASNEIDNDDLVKILEGELAKRRATFNTARRRQSLNTEAPRPASEEQPTTTEINQLRDKLVQRLVSIPSEATLAQETSNK